MLPPPAPSPASASSPEDSQLPQGQCRYILTQADLKGHRCACVIFSRRLSFPGATCDCGHQACFHLPSADTSSPGRQDDLTAIKSRVQALEQQEGLLERLSQMEESLDKAREELQNEIKGSYRNISAAWQLIEQLQRRLANFEEVHRLQSEKLDRASQEIQDLRNRNLELLETDEMLEERLEKLEGAEGMDALLSPEQEAVDVGCTPDAITLLQGRVRRRSSGARSLPQPLNLYRPNKQLATPRSSIADAPGSSKLWTVHISILPSRRQPFPFEKDTVAYKRCLSRGLQRMVAVSGTDEESFSVSVSTAFRDVLQGAPWEPLQVRICDARDLEGLPLLRPLSASLGKEPRDLEFLRSHCAVCDSNGRIQAMYIAPREHSLSWQSIMKMPTYVEGLECSWESDKQLDGPAEGEHAIWTGSDPCARLPAKRSSAEMSTGHTMGESDELQAKKRTRAACPAW
ncbi:uncharacterized protein F5Z01DRAFT_629635 [Emericellopsis atlantica]|uniref:Uncharacterized protein n=1 Tax=Emericellopsis atlantica TaxID=2614577 RepID=A0A9P8CKW9_9HYPO|nr:uncharacterized protein F5Z01DRAFT_629635 [Emericellopsis atlantica]KAG9250380.1 hypothetical protein F5Z01DRAFT_629635 [Emericellopsis atlantica]